MLLIAMLHMPRAVSDSTNQVLWRWEGDAFGTSSPQVATIKIPLRMAGQYADDETGLFYNYFRFYDPKTGRYVENDPIGLAGGMNRWAYVGGSPLHMVDPRGQFAFLAPIAMAISEAVGGLSISGATVNAIGAVTAGFLIANEAGSDSATGDPNNDDQKCKSLARKIQNLKDEVYNKRIPDLENNPGNLPERIGPGEQLRDTIRGHRKLLNRQWRRLQALEEEYDKKCRNQCPSEN